MKKSVYFIALFLVLCNCKPETEQYENQIGDTPYNPKLDSPNFKFCDSSNVLHKRARITYTGGEKAFEIDIINSFKTNPIPDSFSGFAIVRFAVNCKDEIGRIRIQLVDIDFNSIVENHGLVEQIKTTIKNLNNWNHAYYEGKSYDGYTFRVLKILNGEIIMS